MNKDKVWLDEITEEMDTFRDVQMLMGEWIKQGLPMPIDDINGGKSRDLLFKVLEVPYDRQFRTRRITPDELRKLKAMLGPHGYAYFKMLLAQVEP